MVGDIDVLRKDTEEIININPIEIIFIRNEKQEDEFGNIKNIEKRTKPQRVRIAELSHNETDRLIQEGLLKNHVVNITARYNADIQSGDKFDFCGNRYEVEFIRKITVGGYDNVFKMSGKAKEINEATE